MLDYSIDCIVQLVNYYLKNEWEPTATTVESNGNEYVFYTINSHPFVIDPLDLIFKGMERFEEEQEWKKC